MELCRLCDLETKPDSYEHIFNDNIDPPIWKMIGDLTNLTLLENDPYTKIVCFQCFDQLQKFHVFREMVLYTDWRIRNIRHKNNDTETNCPPVKTENEQETMNIEQYVVKIENETDKDNYICNKSIGDDDNMVIIDDPDETITVEEPKNCSDTIENKTPNYEEAAIDRGLNGDSNDEIKEKYIDESFTPKKAKSSSKTRKNKGFQCYICNKICTEKANLKRHITIHAANREYYPCTICGNKFTTKYILERHLKSGNYEHECEVCNKTFPARCVYRLHLKEHLLQSSNDNNDDDDDDTKTQEMKQSCYQCAHCPKSFPYHSQFIRHLRVHTGNKPFKCNICNTNFAGKPDLRLHLLVHTGVKKYQCDKCGQTFAKLHSLNSHVKAMHTKLLNCQICNETFNSIKRFRAHVKEHSTKP